MNSFIASLREDRLCLLELVFNGREGTPFWVEDVRPHGASRPGYVSQAWDYWGSL